ncbi:MAG TPA: hypothetical protein PK441_11230 [Burkholderiaceae bacterium]|nr:hypothetical protein [Burkholderiaceae bacterium]
MTCIGAIRPGRYLTRGGKEVYIAVCSNVNADGSRNAYPWWVEDGKSGWSVDDAGKHLKNGVTAFDIVSRLDAALDAPTTGEAQR